MGYYGTGLPELFGKAGAWPKGRGQPLGCGMDHSSSFCMRVRIPAKSDDLDAPRAEIRNDQIRAAMYLPDREKGFYHATRFDWSGVVFSLRHKHHEYYGPWFNDTSPSVHDFVYDGPNSITAGPCSAAVGPVDAFGAIGYNEAAPGGTFIKIGIGGLLKPDNSSQDDMHLYELATPGTWTVAQRPAAVDFLHELTDPSGYSYSYRKVVSLTEAGMVLQRSLTNTGSKPINTTV